MRSLINITLIAAAIAGAAVTSLATRALAAPTPSIVPISWELTFRHGDPERLSMTINGQKKTFWYMRYTVINNSGKDILFTPDFQLVTDTGDVVNAYKDIPADIFAKIKSLYKKTQLLSSTEILGKLLQGEDNAKDGVIIFNDFDHNAREIEIYAAGLSGETAQVDNPVTHEPAVLQKTLILDYVLPGQAIGIAPAPKLKAVKWVMK